MKTKINFLIAFALLDISIGYSALITTSNGCRASFIHSTLNSAFKISKEDTLDYFKKFFPKDHQMQAQILDFQKKVQDSQQTNYTVPINIEQNVFKEDNGKFLIQAITSQPQLVNFKDKNERTLLHLAVIYNNLEVSMFLLKFIRLLNQQDITESSPLLLSMTRTHNIDIFKMLIKHPLVNFSVRDSFGHNIFHYIFLAKEQHRENILDLLFEHLDSNMISNSINAVNKQGESPMNYLIRDFNIQIANKITKAVPVNFSQRLKNGNTLLHTASSIPDLRAIKFLLEHSNGIDQENHLGVTPIQVLKSYYPDLTEGYIIPRLLNGNREGQL